MCACSVSYSSVSGFCLSCSGHCFCPGVVSDVRSTTPLTKSPHMVALVSLPPRAGGQRGLTVATDLSQEKGSLVTVIGWVQQRVNLAFTYLLNFNCTQKQFNLPPFSALPHLSTTYSLIVTLLQVRLSGPQPWPSVLYPHWWPRTGGQRHPCPQHFPGWGRPQTTRRFSNNIITKWEVVTFTKTLLNK